MKLAVSCHLNFCFTRTKTLISIHSKTVLLNTHYTPDLFPSKTTMLNKANRSPYIKKLDILYNHTVINA